MAIHFSLKTKMSTAVRTELNSLHAGNFARYRVRPAEFAVWQEKRKPS